VYAVILDPLFYFVSIDPSPGNCGMSFNSELLDPTFSKLTVRVIHTRPCKVRSSSSTSFPENRTVIGLTGFFYVVETPFVDGKTEPLFPILVKVLSYGGT